jgi:predicted TPR repeat methyltransferase
MMKKEKLKRRIASHPDDLDARQELVTCYHQEGKRDDAIQSLLEITKRWPNHVDAYNFLGSIYLKRCEWKSAGQMYMQILRLVPGRVQAWVNLAYIFDKIHNHEEAIRCSSKAISLKPEAEKAHGILAFSLLKSGRREEARQAFERLLALFPDSDHTEAEYFLAALNGGSRSQPKQSPAKYVRSVFDGCAHDFEKTLVDRLKYDIPGKINIEFRKLVSQGYKYSAIDLGCGTGLMGEQIKDLCGYLVGVDLSEKMLEIARKKNIYDELLSKDIVVAVAESNVKYDLVLATDVFVYIGDLAELFSLVARSMNGNGLFGFSIEFAENHASYVLQSTGRYAHALSYVQALAEANQLVNCVEKKVVVRMEHGEPINGYIFVYMKEN